MSTAPTTCDLLIHSGDVIDGTGAARAHVDVAVTGDRIVAVGDHLDSHFDATSKIDASGLVVAPGFIDAHTHDDRAVLSGPDMTPKISQGVTSVVTGNCGVSLAPFTGPEPPPPMNLLGDDRWYRFATMREYMAEVEASPPALNLAPLVGHTALRATAMDDVYRAASAAEISHMETLLDEALEAGCIGLSTGLAYPPAFEAPTDEVVTLANRLGAYGAIYATHMRDEGTGVLDSVRETLDIGQRAGVPVVISHHKCNGRESWGMSRETLSTIAHARAKQTVNLDVYPYIAGSTVLLADWVAGTDRVLVTWSAPYPDFKGRRFRGYPLAMGLQRGRGGRAPEPGRGHLFQDERRGPAAHPALSGRDDRFGRPPARRLSRIPGSGGTFPRVLGHYCRELGLFPLEEAVHRMTGVPARVFGLTDRGTIRAGACADLVLFDAERIIDESDFSAPTRPATGIYQVIVNGQQIWRGGEWTGATPGRILRRQPPGG